nr:dodecin domain-containing protein [Akkermansiaceae bacterium]
MSEHVYQLIELTGTSPDSIEAAVNSAVQKAARSTGGVRWVQVTEIRGNVIEDRIDHWQVSVKVGY